MQLCRLKHLNINRNISKLLQRNILLEILKEIYMNQCLSFTLANNENIHHAKNA